MRKYRNPKALILSLLFVFYAAWAMAAGIKVVPSSNRVSPGDSFYVDVVVEGVPQEGLGTIQFRLNVNAVGSSVFGIPDLGQAKSDSISVASPLIIDAPTSTRSGIGDFFLGGKGPNGILVLDNESLSNGSALFTYAHTSGSTPPSGGGAVARFQMTAGSAVNAEKISISLSDVMILDGGTEYPTEYNIGAVVQLRCQVNTPSLLGLSLADAQNALAGANLTLGNTYEINNDGSRPLNIVLEQSSAPGAAILCGTAVDLAVNASPNEVTQLTASDKIGDDIGTVVLSWSSSSSGDVAGYKVYSSSTLLKTIITPSAAGTEIGGLANGTASQLKVTVYDTFGNESQGATVQATSLDDVPPVITVTGVQEGSFYPGDITPLINVFDNHLSTKTVTLNGAAYNGTPITTDGVYTLGIEALDASGNHSSKTLTFSLDKTPPSIAVTGIEEGRYYNADLTPVVTVTDTNLKEQTVALNGQPYTGAIIAAEGSYLLTVTATDMVGHSVSEVRHFYIDKTSPVSSASIGSPKIEDGGKVFVTGSTPLTLAASDPGMVSSGISKTEYNVDNLAQWSNYGSGISLLSAIEGEHSISYKSLDIAGNLEASKQVAVTVDNSAPVTNAAVGEPKFQAQDGSFFVSQGTAFTLAASDLYSGVAKTEYRVNNGQWAAYAPFNMANEGTHIVEYRSLDRLGNTEAARSLTAVVDNTPPVTSHSIGAPKYITTGNINFVTGGTLITLNAEDASSGVAATEYRIDGGVWTAYAPISIQPEGSHLVEYRSKDRTGNLEAAKSVTVAVDNTPPVTSISTGTPNYTAQDGKIFVTSSTQFTLSSSDSGSGVKNMEYRVDGGPWTSYAPFSAQGNGSHLVEYRAVDNLDNAETARSLTVIVDDLPPVTELTTSGTKHIGNTGVIYITGSTQFALTASDNLSGAAKTEYRIDSGVWTTYAPFTIVGEGEHTVSYRSYDNLGNLEGAKVYTVMVDNTPPASALTLGTPKYEADGSMYIGGGSSFTLSASDAMSGVKMMEYKIDGGQWSEYTAAFTLSTLSNGQHTIHYRGTDNLGNVELEKTLSFIIDNTPPETAITVALPKFTGANGSLYGTKNTEFALASIDNLSGVSKVEYRIDGGAWVEYAAFKIVAEGSHVIGFRSIDNLGNTEVEKTLAVIVDNTPPVSQISTGDPKHTASDGKLFVAGISAFNITALDNLSGLSKTEYRVDAGIWTTYASSFTIPSEGSHLIEYRSFDNIGNLEQAKSLTVVIDNTPPVSAIDAGAPKYESNGNLYVTAASTFTVTASDNLSGVNRSEYRRDGESWTEYSGSFTNPGLTDGPHTIGYRSTDNIGNVEAEKALAIVVDNTPPQTEISVTGPKFSGNGNLYATKDTEFALGSTDNLSGTAKTEYRIDDGPWMLYVPFKIPAEGNHVIGYRSTDNVGNIETTKTLTFIVDNTPPVTEITVGMPKYASPDGTLYVAKDASFTLTAADNYSGVKMTEYRVDGGQWTIYALFTISSEGSHLIEFRSMDNLGNMEAVRTLSVTVDNTPPVTELTVGTPRHESGGTTYVSGMTPLTLTGKDQLSGVEYTEFRVDGGSWTTGTSIGLPGEGTHTIGYRSKDRVGNLEDEKSAALTVDNTPPATNIEFSYQKYSNGQAILVSKETQVILSASDNLSGVKGTYYRFDDETGWRSYFGAFKLTELAYGSHTIRFRSSDNVDNSEAEQIVTVTLIAVEVKTEVKNLPRVLVWIGDNKAYDEDKIDEEEEKNGDNSEPYNEAGDESENAGAVINYTADNVKAFVASAFSDPDIYTTITTDKNLFINQFRSGIYNMVVILDQNRPLSKVFLRELKESVNRGNGLFVSGWRNKSVHIMEELLGVKYKGSMSGHDKVRQIEMYQSPISSEQTLASRGRIQKTVLREGTLAGIVKGEEICDGVKGVSLKYKTDLAAGDAVKVSLSVPSGKKLNLIDEETFQIDALPSPGANMNASTGSGDVSIDGVASDGVDFSINSVSGYLKSSYSASVTVVRQNGSSATTGNVAVTPTCNSKIGAGMTIGPLDVVSVLQDTHTKTEGVPAAVLNNYGEGKTVFLAYNIVESAMNSNAIEYASIMKNAVNYILPQEAKPEAGGITLLETKVRLSGNDIDIKAEDTLGDGLTHMPLFNLTKTPLEYTFHLSDGQEGSYRYFVRVRDKVGNYGKDTDIYLGIGSGYSLFDKYSYAFAIDVDSDLMMQQAVVWVNEQISAHPESTESLNAIRDELVTIAFMPKITADDMDKVIHQVVQTIHHINQLPFDSSRGREIMDGYLRVMEGKYAR